MPASEPMPELRANVAALEPVGNCRLTPGTLITVEDTVHVTRLCARELTAKRETSEAFRRLERTLAAKQFTIFASTHTDTGTDFMVVRETKGMMLLRIYHNRLELLQEALKRKRKVRQ